MRDGLWAAPSRRGLGRLVHLCAFLSCCLAVAASGVRTANATPVTGDQVTFTANLNPSPAAVYTADIVLGASTGAGQMFQVSSFSVFNSGGGCITCGFTEDLSNVLFDASTKLLSGSITGTIRSSGMAYDLVVTDPGGTWTFTDGVRVLSGSYSDPAPVDEPPTIALLGVALLLAFGWVRARPRSA